MPCPKSGLQATQAGFRDLGASKLRTICENLGIPKKAAKGEKVRGFFFFFFFFLFLKIGHRKLKPK